jgi:16S rRNA (guanine(966)-N(2))-methyltransferase RsmD
MRNFVKYQIRIIGGELRGRKIEVKLVPDLRPMSDRARGALFNILVHEVPGRPFFDVFAGSGAVGLEALSRGASQATFVEKDGMAVQSILKYGKTFGVSDRVRVLQVDAYRWVEKGALPSESANYFLGPPYRNLTEHGRAVVWMVTILKERSSPGSVIVLQTDDDYDASQLPDSDQWDTRRYGRNQLAIWRKAEAATVRGDDEVVRPGDSPETAG